MFHLRKIVFIGFKIFNMVASFGVRKMGLGLDLALVSCVTGRTRHIN